MERIKVNSTAFKSLPKESGHLNTNKIKEPGHLNTNKIKEPGHLKTNDIKEPGQINK